MQSPNGASIRVVCRFRPLNEKELAMTNKEGKINFISKNQLQFTSIAEAQTINFNFDYIFPPTSTQKEIYESSSKEIIASVLQGYNGTIFAYGQTSSGKTYTMTGEINSPEKEGIIPRMIHYVFDQILHSENLEIEFTVKVSFIEIYMEKIKDLIDISRVNLQIHESKEKGIYIENLSEYYVSNEQELLDYVKIGNQNRTIASTNMNDTSSRSHSIVILSISQRNVVDNGVKNGKLYLVDLAGSEKVGKTGAEGITLEEAKMINKSLSALGMVINSLTDGKSFHIPYRDSKLTRILSESLGGNAKTCLIITCSPSSYNEAETLSTLRFGARAKMIKNKPKVNKIESVKELKGIISQLQTKIKELEKIIGNSGISLKQFKIDSENEILVDKGEYELLKKKINDLEEKNEELMKLLQEKGGIVEEKEIYYKNLEEEIKKLKSNEVSKEVFTNYKIDIDNARFSMTSNVKNEINLNDYDMSDIITQNKQNKETESNLVIIENQNSFSIFGTENIYESNQGNFNIDELIKKESKQFESEKKIIIHKILKQKNKIDSLNGEIRDLRKKIQAYEMGLNPDGKIASDKIITLSNTCEQLNNLYQQAQTEKSVLKIEIAVIENKLNKRNEKIKILSKELEDLKNQIKERDSKITILSKKTINSNLVKVIKTKTPVLQNNS